jgi:acetyltransferase EpsM
MNIVLIGHGGHSKVVRDIVLSTKHDQIVGYLDDKFKTEMIRDNLFFAPISAAKKMIEHDQYLKFVIAIGDNKSRKLIYQQLNLANEYYATLIHPSAFISPSATIGDGTVLMAYTVINADAKVGHHTIINTCAVVEHDNQVGDFVHLSPNATLTGAVKIENGVHIGAGATIIPNIKVGEWSIIGAGATVIDDIPANCTAIGIPAKVKINKVTEGV